MSYDLYIKVSDTNVESVFNCSVFNMRPFIAANIKVLSHYLNVLESRRRVARSGSGHRPAHPLVSPTPREPST